MKKHPNEFTRRKIIRHCRDHHMEIEVTSIEGGYVIFVKRFSAFEAAMVEEPVGRLLYDHGRNLWRLYWMSSRASWHLYDRFETLHGALDEMLSEHAANLFQKVL